MVLWIYGIMIYSKDVQKLLKINWPWDLAGWIGIACSFNVTIFQPKRSLTRFFRKMHFLINPFGKNLHSCIYRYIPQTYKFWPGSYVQLDLTESF